MLIRYYVSLILDKDNESVLIYGAGTNGGSWQCYLNMLIVIVSEALLMIM